MEELFTTRLLVHAAAGSTSSCWAFSIFYPLNLVRTRLQVEERGRAKGVFTAMKDITLSEGPSALYIGLWSNIIVLGCSNFVYFYLYNGLRAVLLAWKQRRGRIRSISANLNLLVSSLAGAVNVLVTSPLWVASMRITTQRRSECPGTLQEFNGVFDALYKIGSREGLGALWNGTRASLMLVSNPVIQFVTYEWVKERMQQMERQRGFKIRGIEFFLMGAFAKAVATVLTYPIQLAQSRLRNAKSEMHSAGYTGVADCLLKTCQREGFFGLFRGMEAKLWQTVLMAAFHFMGYEKIVDGVQSIMLSQAKQMRLPYETEHR